MKSSTIWLLALSTFGGSTFAGMHNAHAATAHQHGLARLDVIVSGSKIQATLTLPAADLVGFEHAPSNDDERQQLNDALNRLENAPPVADTAATCRLLNVRALDALDEGISFEETDTHHHQSPGDHRLEDGHIDEGSEAHADHESHGDEEHSDIRISYEMNCADPAALKALHIPWFAITKAERIDTQVIHNGQQRAKQLTRNQPSLVLSD